MPKGVRNKARRAREKAKPLREKPDYSTYMAETSAFEKLPREIRQQIYFYVGDLPIAKRMLLNYPHRGESHNCVVVIKDASFRPTFQLHGVMKTAFWQFFDVDYWNEQDEPRWTKIEISSLLAVSKSIRCELLHLLLDAGISVHIGPHKLDLQQYMFGSASIQQIREVRSVATMSHVASFKLDCHGGDGTKVFCKNLTFVAQHAVNLREMIIEVYSTFSRSDRRANVNRMIRSLHDFVRTASSERFDLLVIRNGTSTEQQILRKKDFQKTCAWAVAVIQQTPSSRSEITRIHDIDINSIEEHDHRYVFCAELPWWYN